MTTNLLPGTCEEVGLDVSRVLVGSDIDGMSDSALGQVAEETSVFARLSPGRKNRVLNALKIRGHVVGFLGDGVNDAPSLRTADIGITVSSAVDVAKDAAEVTLFHTGWFVESLATQTLVLFIIRAGGNPFRSRPSRPLVVAVLVAVTIGVLLPGSPLAGPLGFVPLPVGYLLFVAATTVTHLLLVEVVKHRVLPRTTT